MRGQRVPALCLLFSGSLLDKCRIGKSGLGLLNGGEAACVLHIFCYAGCTCLFAAGRFLGNRQAAAKNDEAAAINAIYKTSIWKELPT